MRSPIERRTRTGSPVAAGLGRTAAAARAALPWAKTRRVSVILGLPWEAGVWDTWSRIPLPGATGENETAFAGAVPSPRLHALGLDQRNGGRRGEQLDEVAGGLLVGGLRRHRRGEHDIGL